MQLSKEIIPVVLTKNEEKNIKKCLKSLTWAKKVLIFDSQSNDRTINMAKQFPNTKIIKCKYTLSYVDKLNYICQSLKDKLILVLDADYELSYNLIKEISKLQSSPNIFAYKIKIYNKINDIILKENLYPSKILLFKSKKNLFKKYGHKEIIGNIGKVILLKSYIIHHDKKVFKTWLKNQISYAQKDAKIILNMNFSKLTISNKLRRLPFLMNFISFCYYFFKLNFKYKIPGLIYILKRQIYECILSCFIFYYLIRDFFNLFTLNNIRLNFVNRYKLYLLV
jgi:hypothetical protein